MTRSSIGKEKAEFNAEILKMLLKLPGNKYCSDCKRNDHPRWASWSLGVFLCIRCSGIHRSMGTHISRVKSVDLDTWTNEQLENMIRWGNTRANKYWEAKLITGHIPSESKIDNYIRTKYELKRWIMDGPIPDPSTLDENNDNEILHNLLNNFISEKKQFSSLTSKNSLRAQIKDNQSYNLVCFSEQKDALFKNNKNSSFIKNSTESKESLFGSNLKNCTTISESCLSVPKNRTKSSQSDLKTSILSLYSMTPTFKQNNMASNSLINTPLHETPKTSKHESKSSNTSNDISEDLKKHDTSEKKKTSHTPHSSYDFSNPTISYLLNTQKLSSTSTSFDIIATKESSPRINPKPIKDPIKGMSSSNIDSNLENLCIKGDTAKLPKNHINSTSDSSFKQSNNEGLSFYDFQSSSSFPTDSDTLSFQTFLWSTDKPAETKFDFNNYKTPVLQNDNTNDKNNSFYDDFIISTTDVWK